MSKITKARNGAYVGTIDLGNGLKVKVPGATHDDCASKLRAVEASLRSKEPSQHTVASLLEWWLTEIVPIRNKPTTLVGYKHISRAFLIPELGYIALSDLTPDHIQALITKLIPKYRPESIHRVRSCLRRALNVARQRGWITTNPAALVELPTIHHDPVKPLSVEEVGRLLAVVKGHRLEALYHLAVKRGLRQGELLALQCEDVDLEGKVLRVSGTLRRLDGKLQRLTPKTKTSGRLVPLSDELVAMLRPHMKARGYLFRTKVETPIEPTNILRHFRIAAKQATLPTQIFHHLRHTCASLLVREGVHLSVIAAILGHSNISTTANVYAHVMPDTTRAAADKLDDLLGEKPE